MSEKTILVIDDESLIRRTMADYLAECGYGVATAADGAEGLAQARSSVFDAVLVDLRMPSVDGLQVIATLKAEQPHLPLVVVSGTGVLDDAIEAMRLGAWDYVTKPIQDMEEIVLVVEQVLDRAQLLAERAQAEEALQKAHDQLEQRVEERTAELQEANTALQAEITERVRVEQALRENEERFRALVQNSSDIIVVLGADGALRFASPALERVLGYEPESMLGVNPFDYLHPEDLPATEAKFVTVLQQPGVPITDEFRIRHANGSWVSVETITSNLLDTPGVEGIVINARDITERERLVAQFLQAQKMEAIGRLAGGVAHDFNNLLTVIQLSTRLMERQLHPQDPFWEHVQQIKEAGERAAKLIQQLLSFSRKEMAEPRVTNLSEVIGDLGRMLQRIIGEDIELSMNLDGELWQTTVDPAQMEQVIVNLAVNARDAMPQGGRLNIETANIVLDQMATAYHVNVQPGEYVMLSVSDTGVGMSPDVQEHIFEPFFTTKAHSKGTGLGLSTVYAIVKNNGGLIWVYSEVGYGTIFKIYLPRTYLESIPSAPPVEQPPYSASRGTERILVVEDDKSVRELAVRILRGHGYEIFAAGNGLEALRLVEQQPDPIHLLLTDVVMPEMSGKELADRLQEHHPDLRVLYISGYSSDTISHRQPLDKDASFLSKPFTIESLTRMVRAVLDARA